MNNNQLSTKWSSKPNPHHSNNNSPGSLNNYPITMKKFKSVLSVRNSRKLILGQVRNAPPPLRNIGLEYDKIFPKFSSILIQEATDIPPSWKKCVR